MIVTAIGNGSGSGNGIVIVIVIATLNVTANATATVTTTMSTMAAAAVVVVVAATGPGATTGTSPRATMPATAAGSRRLNTTAAVAALAGSTTVTEVGKCRSFQGFFGLSFFLDIFSRLF